MNTIVGFNEAQNRNDLGNKNANLIKLYNEGYPVPYGFSVPFSTFEHYCASGEIPFDLVSELTHVKNKQFSGKMALRSSANCEDGESKSMAGVFDSLFIEKDEDIEPGLRKLFEQANSMNVTNYLEMNCISHTDLKLGLVAQQLIESDVTGVIYTGINGDNILIQYFKGFDSDMLDVSRTGSSFICDKDGLISQSVGFDDFPIDDKIVETIVKYAVSIKNLFGDVEQDIEFSIKDGDVRILQARPLTTDLGKVELIESPEQCVDFIKRRIEFLSAEELRDLGTKEAIFSDSNYSELLPRPKEMDIGLYQYIGAGADGIEGASCIARRDMGYLCGQESVGSIMAIGGHTYFSISRNAGLYYMGFPNTKEEYFKTLVNGYLDEIEADPMRGNYPQMWLYLQDPTLEILVQKFGAKGEKYHKIYLKFLARMDKFAEEFLNDFNQVYWPKTKAFIAEQETVDFITMDIRQIQQYCEKVLEHLRIDTYVLFIKAARLGYYYSKRTVDKLKTLLPEGVDSGEIYSSLIQGLDGSAITDANREIAEAGSVDEAMAIARKLIGHFSTGEMLEIHHPRLLEDEETLLTYVSGIRNSKYIETFNKQKEERLQTQKDVLAMVPQGQRTEMEVIYTNAQKYVALRETAKYIYTMEYSAFKNGLEMLQESMSLEQGDIYHLFPRELKKFVDNPHKMMHLINSRKISFKNYLQIEMPNIIRPRDVEGICVKGDDPNIQFTEAQGFFLANGQEVDGIIVNADIFTNLDDVYKTITDYLNKKEKVILVAKQMNLSHDPIIALCDGIVIENAGILAHGAQRAREQGKGAIGGIKSSMLKTGTKVRFSPKDRKITNLEKVR